MAQSMYQQRTRSIQISVEPFYVDDQSSPANSRFVFGYHVKIDNQGEEAVQLMSRYWRITDALGRTVEVEGPGVVGEQPLIEPGDLFEYTSRAPLATPSGVMIGRYQMITASGEAFDADIPAFSLDAPGAQMRMN